MTYSIEPVSQQDIPALVEMGRRAHAESRYRDWPFSQPMVEELFKASSQSPNQLALKALRDGEIVGFLLGGASTMVFSEKPIGVENTFWITPECRGSRCGVLLITAFLDWCEQRRLPAFIIPSFAEDNSSTYSLLERLGLKENGRIYTRGI